MRSYNTFAQFYDSLTENVDYKNRTDYIVSLFDKVNGSRGKALDLACGTGSVALHLKEKGFDVIGVDSSQEMLAQADNKASGIIEFICSDMTSFQLNEKVDLCVCSLDSINHLLTLEDVKRCFDCVYNSLTENGVFIFDVNTPFKHNCILADNTFVFDEEDFFLSWDNELESDDAVRILLDFFVFNGVNYDRFSEEFYEKAYSVEQLKSVLDKFDVLSVYDDMTENSPNDKSERIYFVCKRKNN